MKFKGTIIITDPCYIVKDNSEDWRKCSYGHYMENLGITNYICESTIYGDWGCTTYKITENPYEVVDNFVQAAENGEDYWIECSSLGDFCADAGLVAVFDLEEVRKYNPNIDEWIKSHSNCVTTITGFDGNIEYYVDEAGDAHIIGIGNINFFTTQTEL